MKLVKNALQVWHYPQIGNTAHYAVNVSNEIDANRIINILANQHCFLFEHNFIPDYSNVFLVTMWDNDKKEWVDYYNPKEQMDWPEFENTYLQ